jgi:hypothetical protein
LTFQISRELSATFISSTCSLCQSVLYSSYGLLSRASDLGKESTVNGLSVGDGFKFGCGFLLAGFIAWLAMVIIGVIASVIFGGALTALFSRFEGLTQLAPMLLSLI